MRNPLGVGLHNYPAVMGVQKFSNAVYYHDLQHLLPTDRNIAGSDRAIAEHFGLTIPENGSITEWTDRLIKEMENA